MEKLKENELRQIVGGASITGALINAYVRGIEALMDLGRTIGTSIRRAMMGSAGLCNL